MTDKKQEKVLTPNRNCLKCGGELRRESASKHVCLNCGATMWIDPKDTGHTYTKTLI